MFTLALWVRELKSGDAHRDGIDSFPWLGGCGESEVRVRVRVRVRLTARMRVRVSMRRKRFGLLQRRCPPGQTLPPLSQTPVN
jgi:hypothetical protein